jgi:methylglutaconyl-CoA hydratase
MSEETLTLEIEGDELATITLSRPSKRNALSPEMIDGLLSCFEEVERRRVRVVILTGSGKAFCAGMDLDALAALASKSPEQHLLDSRHMAKMFRALYALPMPTIAAVNGAAMAGGTGLATLCDLTLAVPGAKFGYTEVKIGFIPAIVSVFLRRQIGDKRARDLLLTGRVFDAAEAHALGLVTEIVSSENLLARAQEIAKTLIAASPTSLRRTKKLLGAFSEAELDRELELAVQANAAIRSTFNFKEGLASFLEKRSPNWRDEN